MASTVLLVSRDCTIGREFLFGVGTRRDWDLRLRSANTVTDGSAKYEDMRPALVIFDAGLGRRECLLELERIRRRGDCVCLLGVAEENDPQLREWGLGPRDLFQRPFDPALLVARVVELLVPTKGVNDARASA